MYINHNIMAMTAYRNYSIISQNLARSLQRLSTGLRINSAADDPAGLAISEKMRAQIRGLNVASSNVQGAINLVRTADGALSSTHAILQRMNELAIQAASDTNEFVDRNALDLEYQELLKELNDIAGQTDFNGRKLLDGSCTPNDDPDQDKSLYIQTGPNAGDYLKIGINAMNSAILGLDGTNLLTREAANEAMTKAKDAINQVSTQRAYLGAMESRLGFKLSYLENMAENLQAAESRIRDVDIAKEMSEFVKNQILLQASIAVMAQANAIPQMVLRLLWTL